MKKGGVLCILPAIIILFAACTQVIPSQENVRITMTAVPSPVPTNSKTLLYIDVENNSTKTYSDIMIELFDCAGFTLDGRKCEGNCWVGFGNFLPGEFRTLVCNLTAPDVERATKRELRARVLYETGLDAVKTISFITFEEYQRRVDAGTNKKESAVYYFDDGNLELELLLSAQPPFITGEQRYVYFTINNIGNGFMDTIRKEDVDVSVIIAGTPASIMDDCDMPEEIKINGRRFPRITCALPSPVMDKPIISYDLLFSLRYEYELRKTMRIEIVK